MGRMLRQFRRDRGFFIVVVALLGLGIGSATLVFGLVNELLLKPLPVRDPGNLYMVQRSGPVYLRPDTYFTERHWHEVVERTPEITASVAATPLDPQFVTPFREGGATRLLMAQAVSANYFTELGIRAALGRVLDGSDARVSGNVPGVISYQFWRAQFGADPTAVGRTIRLRDQAVTIVGVLPREFHSIDIDRAADVRVPLAAAPLLFGAKDVAKVVEILVRLTPGAAPARAAAAMQSGLASVEDWRPGDNRKWTPSLEPLERGLSRVRQQFGDALRLLLAGVGVLLLAVCANVAGLLIARAGERRREFGIRAALGASRGRMLRQLLGEMIAVAIPGGLAGAAFASLVAPRVVRLLPPVRDLATYATPQLLEVGVDWRVIGFAAAVTLFAAIVAGLIPAWRASRVDLVDEMKAVRPKRSMVALVAPIAMQAAFCTVLLTASGLMLRSWWKLDHLDAGFDRDHLIEFTVDPGSAGYGMQQSGTVFAEMRRRVGELPGVRSAAWAWRGVMRGSGIKTTFAPQGVVLPRSTRLNTSMNEVSPGYFETMGMRLVTGRDVQPGDQLANPGRVVINRALADLFFPGQDPIGRGLVPSTDGTKPPNRVLVGVVSNSKYRSLREPDAPTVFGAFDETKGSDWQVVLYVRTHGAPSAMAAAVRQTLRAVDADVPVTEAHTLDEEIRASLWQERLVAILSAFFGLAAAGLAAIGLYGALTLSVTQRRKELGIRVAIGAQLRDVLRTLCGPMAWGIACGTAVGIGAAAVALRVTRALLYGVEPLDGVSIAGAVAVLAACSAIAAVRPARRAARVDPALALREE